MSLVRLFGTKSACRTLEYQISTDADETGKSKKLSTKEGRRWDKIADNFIEVSDDFDTQYEKILDKARIEGNEINKELLVAQGDDELLPPMQLKVSIFNVDVQLKLKQLEESVGEDKVELDISEEDLEFINKLWNEIQTPRERAARKQFSAVTDMLNSKKTLVKTVEGKYVPEE